MARLRRTDSVAATAQLIDAVHARRPPGGDRRRMRRGRGRARRRHHRLGGLRRRRCTQRAARRRSWTCCSLARPRRRVAAPAAGPPCRRRTGDGVLPLQQRRRRRAARDRRAWSRSGCSSSTGMCITGTGRTTSSTPIRASCSCRSTSRPWYPGSGGAADRGSGRGHWVHREPAGPRRQRRCGLPRARGSRRRARRPCVRAAARARLGGVRRARGGSAGGLHRDGGGLRGDGRERAAPGSRARRAGRPRPRGWLRPDRARGLPRRDPRGARTRPVHAAGAPAPSHPLAEAAAARLAAA